MSESNQRRDSDFDYSNQDNSNDIDRENAQDDGREQSRMGRDDMNRRGMMIDSDVRHQAGTDLHDGGEYDQQEGARYDERMGSGGDMQEGARSSGHRMEGSAFDLQEGSRYEAQVNAGGDVAHQSSPAENANASLQAGASTTSSAEKPATKRRGGRKRKTTPATGSSAENVSGSDMPDQYQSSVAGEGMTANQPRNSGTGETDARKTQRRSKKQSITNVGDEGFSDTVTPASGAGAVRVDPEGDYSLADTEQTQADHFRAEREVRGQLDDSSATAHSQAEHFQQERKAQSHEGGFLGMTNTNDMRTDNMRTVAAVFRNWDEATHAVHALQDAGFDDDEIGIARMDDKKGSVKQVDTSGRAKDTGENVAGGIAAGAAVGGVTGLLAALASLAIPGVGPIVAGGVLATTFGTAAGTAIASAGVGAGIGAAAGGLIGALTSLGLSEEEARYYESDMRSGSTLVTVRADYAQADEAIRVLQQSGGQTRSRLSSDAGNSTDPNWRFG